MILHIPNWVEISRSAFNHNISALKNAIGSCDLAIVIKANAYGHGMQEIATLAEDNPHINLLCVAFASEARALLAAGIQKPILVMSYIDCDPYLLMHPTIRLMVDTPAMAEHLHTIGKQYGYCFPIHVKVDTGLSRFGVPVADALSFIQRLTQLSHLSIEGLYSHFSESDKSDRAFTYHQIAQFKTLMQQVEHAKITIPRIHFSNSAATTTLDLPFATLFRVGINAYGLWPNSFIQEQAESRHPSMKLKPILTWKSRIISIKEIPPGEFVGYGRTFQTTGITKVAIIPIGYYDGYDIRFSNNGLMLCNGRTAPIIGRIAMNTTMIDITDSDATINDEVIIMGPYQEVTPPDLGMRICQLNVRELMTKINPNIPRIICP